MKRTLSQRRWSYRPHLETLEDRLPPGDILLGAILASTREGLSLAALDADPWSAEVAGPSALIEDALALIPAPGHPDRLSGEPEATAQGTPPTTPRRQRTPAAAAWMRGATGPWRGSMMFGETAAPSLPPDTPAVGAASRAGWGTALAPVAEAAGRTEFAGYLDVLLGGSHHASDPAAAVFDRALAGASQTTLTGIRREEGSAPAPLVLGAQTLTGNLTVRADRPVLVTGEVAVAGRLSITAPALTVRGTLHGAAVDLASTGVLNVESGGVTAGWGDRGGRITVAAGVLINTGQFHADGAMGGAVMVHAGNILNGGQITADGTARDGGTVWVGFTGSYIATVAAVTSARGGRAGRGGDLTIDGGTTGRLFSSGTQQATGAAGGGAVHLRSRDLALVGATVDAAGAAGGGAVDLAGAVTNPADGAARFHLIDPHPTRGGAFGFTITRLSNGNLVVTNPEDDLVAPRAGAVALINGRTGALLSYLVGSSANDRVGGGSATDFDTSESEVSRSGGNAGSGAAWEDNADEPNGLGLGSEGSSTTGPRLVIALRNGNYVVASLFWNDYRGAVTWGDGTVGVTGFISGSNSLIGSNAGDEVGVVAALRNGNYVVTSPGWNESRGAATWGDGTVGVTGVIDAGNSLVGSNPQDYVGVGGATALANGNYVASSLFWNGRRGATTWGDGTVGVTGVIDAGNSLVGNHFQDEVGYSVTALTNGNYVVSSPFWNSQHGAATWGDGTAGVTGIINAGNSLVGNHFQDEVGSVTALRNGNYVVASPFWSTQRGAVTWGDGTVGTRGIIDASNSLVGNSGDALGYGVYGITALRNGNYVVASYFWDSHRGAVTWGNGTVGVTGLVDANNSLVGSNANDEVGRSVTALANGNYVALSFYWNSRRGAATWGDGMVGVTGVIDPSNSLVGDNANEQVSSGGVTALRNGNYVVASPNWSGQHGAVTWGDGTNGITGGIDPSNSLVGSNSRDEANAGITALANGNYVVASPSWNGYRGAVTWGDGTVGVAGVIDPSNSLTGNPGSPVGTRVTALANGNYVIASLSWNGGDGAATWADGTIGIRGGVDPSNSLVGSNPRDQIGAGGVTALRNGNYVVASPNWNGQRGAATWADGTVGVRGYVDPSNSLVGSNAGDLVGSGMKRDPFDFYGGVTALRNGNYVVLSPYWNGDYGAATWADGTLGVTGPVSGSNSLVG